MNYGNTGTVASGSSSTIYSGPPTPPTHTPQANIGIELTEMEKRAVALHQALDELMNRLTPALSPLPPDTARAGDAPIPPASDVVRAMRASGYQIDGAIMRVNEILRRLEL